MNDLPADAENIRVSERPSTWRSALLYLCLVGASVLLFWQMATQPQRQWQEPMSITVSLDGNYYSLNRPQLQWLESFSTLHFDASEEDARRLVATQIGAQLDSTFGAVSSQLPAFADWYYSMPGDYSRKAMSVLSKLDLVEGDFVARRAAEILFPDQIWSATLTQLDDNTSALLARQQVQARQTWLTELQSRLSSSRVPAPIPGLSDATTAPGILVIDSLASNLQALEQSSLLQARMTLSTVSAAGVAGPALWRAVVARSAVNSARVAATVGAARGGSRIGSAAVGAALCAPGGPVAIACATGAFVGTWLATDWLLLQVDESLNRDELLAGLEEGLLELRAGLEIELLEAYDARIAAWHDAALVEIENSFSPAGR